LKGASWAAVESLQNVSGGLEKKAKKTEGVGKGRPGISCTCGLPNKAHCQKKEGRKATGYQGKGDWSIDHQHAYVPSRSPSYREEKTEIKVGGVLMARGIKYLQNVF